jgi:hypothetical protein
VCLEVGQVAEDGREKETLTQKATSGPNFLTKSPSLELFWGKPPVQENQVCARTRRRWRGSHSSCDRRSLSRRGYSEPGRLGSRPTGDASESSPGRPEPAATTITTATATTAAATATGRVQTKGRARQGSPGAGRRRGDPARLAARPRPRRPRAPAPPRALFDPPVPRAGPRAPSAEPRPAARRHGRVLEQLAGQRRG